MFFRKENKTMALGWISVLLLKTRTSFFAEHIGKKILPALLYLPIVLSHTLEAETKSARISLSTTIEPILELSIDGPIGDIEATLNGDVHSSANYEAIAYVSISTNMSVNLYGKLAGKGVVGITFLIEPLASNLGTTPGTLSLTPIAKPIVCNINPGFYFHVPLKTLVQGSMKTDPGRYIQKIIYSLETD